MPRQLSLFVLLILSSAFVGCSSRRNSADVAAAERPNPLARLIGSRSKSVEGDADDLTHQLDVLATQEESLRRQRQTYQAQLDAAKSERDRIPHREALEHVTKELQAVTKRQKMVSDLRSQLVPNGRAASDSETSPPSEPTTTLAGATERKSDINFAGMTEKESGRAVVDDLRAADATQASAQLARVTDDPLLPSTRDPAEGASEQAFNQMLQTVVERDSLNQNADYRRMRHLELELQLTDDPAIQEVLAGEIAKLRKQLSKQAR